jgi:prefoldin alpha subunit
MIQEELQEKYYELELYNKEINNINSQIKETEEHEKELLDIQKNLREFKTLKKGDELLVPIANGIFFKAKLSDNNELRVNVGEGVNVNKNVDETIELLEKHKKDILKFREKLITKITKLIQRKDEIENEAVRLTKEYEKMMKNV